MSDVVDPAQPVGAPSPPGRSRRSRRRRAALEWGILIGGALVIALVIRAFVFQTFWIPTESMVPTLKVDDMVLVNKLSYDLHDPNRGDVVVFHAPPAARTEKIKDLVKRIVGLPGETVEGKNGHIFVNGKQLTESYLPDGSVTRTFAPTKVPPDSYFVIGDNRPATTDSTSFGAIKRDQLIGRAFLRLWPPSRIGFL